MAGSFSDYIEKKLQDHLLGATVFTTPATVYLALFTDSNTPTQRDAGTVTEVSGNNYSRVAITNNATNFPAASGVAATKNLHVGQIFPTPSAGWGTVTAWGLYDAGTVGNLLVWGDLTTAKAINSGDTVSVAADAISCTLD